MCDVTWSVRVTMHTLSLLFLHILYVDTMFLCNVESLLLKCHVIWDVMCRLVDRFWDLERL
jgi:hypothetical protein